MKLIVEETHLSGIARVAAEHNGSSVQFKVESFKSASTPYAEELFDDVNRLLGNMDLISQQAIYDVYVDAAETFNSVRDPAPLHRAMKKVVTELYKHIPYQKVRDYVYSAETVVFPTYLKTDYTETDRQTRDYISRTYLKEEYIDLVILAMGFRFMVPIWGVHVGLIAPMTDNSFKEHRAFDLIKASEIYNWPPRKRLDVYFEASIDTSKIGMAATTAMLDAMEVPEHLQALAVIRKLCLAPLAYRRAADDLVKIIFNFGNGHYNRYDTNFGGRIKSKTDGERIQDEEDNSSVLDIHKANQAVSTADKVMIVTYTENTHRMARRIVDDIDIDKVDLCVNSIVSKVSSFEPYIFQQTLTQWILAEAIPALALSEEDDFPHEPMLRCIGVAQAVLWHWGFLEIAMLMQAVRIEGDYVNMDLRSRVSRDLAKQLDVLYPHTKLEGKGINSIRRNPVTKSIDRLCDTILRVEWKPGGPSELEKQYYKETGSEFWAVPGTIKNQFAELIIHLNQ